MRLILPPSGPGSAASAHLERVERPSPLKEEPMENRVMEVEEKAEVNAPEHLTKIPTESCPTCLSGVDPTIIGDGGFQEALFD